MDFIRENQMVSIIDFADMGKSKTLYYLMAVLGLNQG